MPAPLPKELRVRLRDALAEVTGLTMHHSAMARLLKRLGLTHEQSRWLPPNAGLRR